MAGVEAVNHLPDFHFQKTSDSARRNSSEGSGAVTPPLQGDSTGVSRGEYAHAASSYADAQRTLNASDFHATANYETALKQANTLRLALYKASLG